MFYIDFKIKCGKVCQWNVGLLTIYDKKWNVTLFIGRIEIARCDCYCGMEDGAIVDT